LLGQVECGHPVQAHSYQQDHSAALGEHTKGSVNVCGALPGDEFGGLRPERGK
jgi:hypothetical protein